MALSQEADVFFRVVFGCLICLNFAGNILVCLVVRRFPFMKTPMNYLLVHLAVCDMLMGLFLFPRHVLFGLYDHPDGLTGDLLCKFFTYGNMAWLPSSVSVFTLVVVAWERYNAIMKPFKSRFSKTYLKYAMILCWVLGILVSLPETVAIAYNPGIKSCDLHWIADWGRVVAAGLWLLVGWCLPFFSMLVLYGRVIWSLWSHRHGVTDVSQRSLQLSRKRITKTGVTVTVVLFVTYLPNLIYYLILSISSPTTSTVESLKTAAPVFYPISHLLIQLNSNINPVIYALQSTRFRRCMSYLLCKKLQNGSRVGNNFGLRSMHQNDNEQQHNNNESIARILNK